MKLLWEERAWEEYCERQYQDKKTLKKINTLIRDIQRNCYTGIGKPVYPSRPSALFCSPQCKNKQNVYKSRAKKTKSDDN